MASGTTRTPTESVTGGLTIVDSIAIAMIGALTLKRNYDYLWINQRAYADMTLLNQPGLSKPLRTTIALHLYKDLLNTVPIFAGSDSKFLGKVCMALDTAVYLPGGQVEVLTAGSDLSQEQPPIRLSSSSSVRLSPIPHLRIILKDGDFFGETALVAEVRRTNTVVAITICDLNMLSKQVGVMVYPKVENQLNHLVEKSMQRRQLSSTWKGVYKAKKMADKLKNIQDRAKKTDEDPGSTRTSFISTFLGKVRSKGELLELLPRSSGRRILTSRSMRRESNKKPTDADDDQTKPVDGEGAGDDPPADPDSSCSTELPPRKRKMAAGDLVSRRLNATEIQANFVPLALWEINTMVMDIKVALEKVQKKLAVTNADSDSDDDATVAALTNPTDKSGGESTRTKGAAAVEMPGEDQLLLQQQAKLELLTRAALLSNMSEKSIPLQGPSHTMLSR
ncbi:hypothetical protein DYB30_002419 [Aphanomyces astaci]|uniref:Cyclic nucleotide-binding domain-containing protein n=2 Tax=Aphanomyces astaci TaxID=112090 RepID=A0A397CEY6_APHAT|nr:hypothetical protein DYB30_002419 [Aphanomyces astaci]